MFAKKCKISQTICGKLLSLTSSKVLHQLDPHLTQSLLCVFLNAHHNGSLPLQLKVVWSLLLQTGSEGPTLISSAASWHTICYIPLYKWTLKVFHNLPSRLDDMSCEI